MRPPEPPVPRRSQATLLVFTLGAKTESARRRLLPTRLRGAEVELRSTCFESVLAAGRTVGCRLYVCSPRRQDLAADVEHLEQEGRGFGDRLRRAVCQGAACSGGPVVVVGSDAPGLGAHHLRAALGQLREDPDQVVLGPSEDGGIYLLAAARPIDERILSSVRWCRADTLRSLCRALAEAGRPVILLDPLGDLDGPADLDRWLTLRAVAGGLWRALLRRLRSVLAALRRPPVLDPTAPRLGEVLTVCWGRAPPSAAAP